MSLVHSMIRTCTSLEPSRTTPESIYCIGWPGSSNRGMPRGWRRRSHRRPSTASAAGNEDGSPCRLGWSGARPIYCRRRPEGGTAPQDFAFCRRGSPQQRAQENHPDRTRGAEAAPVFRFAMEKRSASRAASSGRSSLISPRNNDCRPHTMTDLSPVPDLRFSALIGTMLTNGVLRRVTDPPPQSGR